MPGTADETWDKLFDELYLPTYPRGARRARLGRGGRGGDEARRRRGTRGDPRRADRVRPSRAPAREARVPRHGRRPLGRPTGRGEGYRRRVEWPKWIQADFRELPFEEGRFDAVLCLFTSIGYRGEEGDRQAFGEFFRVLKPGASLVLEALHRDRLAFIFQERSWDPLEDDAVRLEERRFDLVTGEIESDLTLLAVGERRSVTFRLRVYTATEVVKLLAEAGFGEIDCFGDFEGGPLSRETRLVVRAKKPD